MFSAGKAYFAQTREGESSWWSWCMVFWITILAWLAGQLLAFPIPIITMATNPELANEMLNSIPEDAGSQKEVMQVFGIVAVAGILSLVFFPLFNENKRANPFGYLTIFTVLLGLFGLVKLLDQNTSAEQTDLFVQMIGDHPANYMLMLLTFPVVLVGLFIGYRSIHKRSITSLHTAASRINWKRIIFAILVTWAVYIVLTAIMHFTGMSEVKMQFDPKRFFIFAAISLILIPIQSGTEEIVFRGYLNKAFGHFINNKWIVFVITSAMFASMHLANPESQSGAEKGALEHILVMSSYFLFGFILCIIVYFEGGLEAAIGVHAANNMFAAIFVNYEGSVLPTPSIFITPPPESSSSFFLVVILGIIALILYKTRDKSLGQEA